jgi:hypothetical protein
VDKLNQSNFSVENIEKVRKAFDFVVNHPEDIEKMII